MSNANEPGDKTAAVTGAGGGLGRDIALGRAAKGYAVFGTARLDTEVADLHKAAGLPTVLTANMEDRIHGPLFPELAEILPEEFAARIKRPGIVDAIRALFQRLVLNQMWRRDMSNLEGKVILITGASGGIGRETALVLGKAGAKVMLLDRDAAAVETAGQDLRKAGVFAEAVAVDVTNEAKVSEVIDGIIARHGRLDGAHNNAGIEQSNKPVHEISLENWTRILSVDLTGVFLCMKHEIRVMLAGSGGSIVNTASALGVVAIESAGDYIAAKHGVIGVTRAAAVDYAKRGIRVNAVLPGIVDTPMIQRLSHDPAFEAQFANLRDRHPIGRFARPTEIAEGVAWLLSDASSFVTGACLAVDGGYLSI